MAINKKEFDLTLSDQKKISWLRLQRPSLALIASWFLCDIKLTLIKLKEFGKPKQVIKKNKNFGQYENDWNHLERKQIY